MSVTPRAPILIITTGRARFGDYLGEILRTEGLNVFEMRKLSSIDAALLRLYEVVILMEGALSDRQVDLFSTYVSDGGRLIGIKPDRGLAEVFGLQTAQGSTGEGYVRFNTSTPVGRGLVDDTLQFHGEADHYSNVDATIAARLYEDSGTATAFPAIAHKGRTVIFTYNLARSIAGAAGQPRTR